ncbi:MAG: hypothetical protein ACE5IQ_03580 [Candidatus Methylomirabilales bacterium]
MSRDRTFCPWRKRDFPFYLLAVGIFLTGCAAGQIGDGTYINQSTAFDVAPPSKAWTVKTGTGSDRLLRSQSRQAWISIHATCGEIPSYRPPKIVGPYRFFGIQRIQRLRENRHPTGHGEVLEVMVQSKLGGRERMLHGYTLKIQGCLYDLLLFASPEDFSAVDREFRALVRQFTCGGGEPGPGDAFHSGAQAPADPDGDPAGSCPPVRDRDGRVAIKR